jgi:hypothetical protein
MHLHTQRDTKTERQTDAEPEYTTASKLKHYTYADTDTDTDTDRRTKYFFRRGAYIHNSKTPHSTPFLRPSLPHPPLLLFPFLPPPLATRERRYNEAVCVYARAHVCVCL